MLRNAAVLASVLLLGSCSSLTEFLREEEGDWAGLPRIGHHSGLRSRVRRQFGTVYRNEPS